MRTSGGEGWAASRARAQPPPQKLQQQPQLQQQLQRQLQQQQLKQQQQQQQASESVAASAGGGAMMGLPASVVLCYESLDPFQWAALMSYQAPEAKGQQGSQDDVLPKPKW
jgi:hypothetical protein